MSVWAASESSASEPAIRPATTSATMNPRISASAAASRCGPRRGPPVVVMVMGVVGVGSKLIGPMRRLPPIMAVIAAVFALAGCGGSADDGDSARNVPESGGLREKVRERRAKADFPSVDGRSLQQVADSMQGPGGRARGPDVHDRRQPARVRRDRPARGRSSTARPPSTSPRRPTPRRWARSPLRPTCSSPTRPSARQAASESDLFAAVYGADVQFSAGQLVGADRHAVRRRHARRAHAGQGRQAREGRHPGRQRGRAEVETDTSRPPRATRSRSTRGSRPRPSCTRSPSRTSSARSPSRCCSPRRSCASRASAAP